MAGDDELAARAALSEMQLRIAEGPYSALGIESHATTEDVRAAFLTLTKQFHPARFGRMSSELQKLSNEVFLGIKSAHDQLQRSLGGSVRGGAASQSGAIPIQTEGTGRTPTPQTVRRTPFGGHAVPGDRGPQFRTQLGTAAPPTQSPTQPLARGTDRPGTPPPGQRPSTPPAGTPRPSPVPGQRPSTPVMTPAPSAPVHRTPPLGISIRPTTPSPTAPAGARPSTPQPQRPPERAATPPVRAATPPVRAATPPGMAPPRPSSDLNPGTIRFSGATPPPSAAPPTQPPRAAGPAFDERSVLRECMMMLNERKWTDARTALNNLAAKVPQSKSYRALLCYARGREAQAAGRGDEAVLEFQRALQLEPELELAKQAIAELSHRR